MLNEAVFAWARRDPEGLRAAARRLADRREPGDDPDTLRLWAVLNRDPANHPSAFTRVLLRARPRALAEAVDILTRRPGTVRAVQARYSYTDPSDLGGYLDRDL
jgi:hypothetical protein